MKKIAFLSGTPIGYFTGSFFSGNSTGQQGRINSFILNLGDWQLHLHHWIMFSLVLIFYLVFLRKKYNFNPTIFYLSMGVLTGLILQGILVYEDWYRILFKKI